MTLRVPNLQPLSSPALTRLGKRLRCYERMRIFDPLRSVVDGRFQALKSHHSTAYPQELMPAIENRR
jgi:hypothetical protein